MKKIVFIAIVVCLTLVINNLVRSIYDLWQKQDLLVEAQNQLEERRADNEKLKAELSYVQSQKFIEEEARNKLFMVKPGEQNVLISSELIKEEKPKVEKNIPNWEKWLNLFRK